MMTTQERYIERIKQLVVKQYGSNITSADDCAALSEAVEKSVGMRIDMPTLQMLFSRNSRMVTPRPLVLSALAKYVGYEDWGDYCTSCPIDTQDDEHRIPIRRRWSVIIGLAVAVVAIALGVVFMLGSDNKEGATSSVTPSPYDDVVATVTKRYVTLAEEQCVALRVYDSTNRLALEAQVEEFVASYSEQIKPSIKDDIRRTAEEMGVTTNDRMIDNSADSIANECIAIINELLEE